MHCLKGAHVNCTPLSIRRSPVIPCLLDTVKCNFPRMEVLAFFRRALVGGEAGAEWEMQTSWSVVPLFSRRSNGNEATGVRAFLPCLVRSSLVHSSGVWRSDIEYSALFFLDGNLSMIGHQHLIFFLNFGRHFPFLFCFDYIFQNSPVIGQNSIYQVFFGSPKDQFLFFPWPIKGKPNCISLRKAHCKITFCQKLDQEFFS